jgi:hypothetical protein
MLAEVYEDFRPKAIKVLRKSADLMTSTGLSGGAFLNCWTADEQETWRRYNALDPLDRIDLDWDARRPAHARDDAAHERRKAKAKELYRKALETKSPEDINAYLDWLLGRGWWHTLEGLG